MGVIVNEDGTFSIVEDDDETPAEPADYTWLWDGEWQTGNFRAVNYVTEDGDLVWIITRNSDGALFEYHFGSIFLADDRWQQLMNGGWIRPMRDADDHSPFVT